MDCGKSTVALQTDHNHRIRGQQGLLFSRFDRSGEAVISSRIGLSRPAVEVHDSTDLWQVVSDKIGDGVRVDYLVCDEVHFYTPAHVEQLARVVDDFDVEVFAFGLLSDFRTSCSRPRPASSNWPTTSRARRSRPCAGAAPGPRTTPGP